MWELPYYALYCRGRSTGHFIQYILVLYTRMPRNVNYGKLRCFLMIYPSLLVATTVIIQIQMLRTGSQAST